jgi:hypothetical protein
VRPWVFKQCGDDLSHENIMKQAANLDITLPMRLQKFNVEAWELFGDTIGND